MGIITLNDYNKQLENKRLYKVQLQQRIVYVTDEENLSQSRKSKINKVLKYKEMKDNAQPFQHYYNQELYENCLKAQKYAIQKRWGKSYLCITFQNKHYECLDEKKLQIYSSGLIRRIIIFLLQSVQNLHNNKRILQDLSFSSIFIFPNKYCIIQQIKLAYFDYKRLSKHKQIKSSVQIASQYFLAPEQLQNSEQFTEYTDAWALGIIIISLTLRIPPNQLADQFIPAKDVNFPSDELKDRVKDPRVRIILNILLNRKKQKRTIKTVLIELKKFPSLDLLVEYCSNKSEFGTNWKKVGEGGFSEVYFAKLKNASSLKEVAVKEIKKKQNEAFFAQLEKCPYKLKRKIMHIIQKYIFKQKQAVNEKQVIKKQIIDILSSFVNNLEMELENHRFDPLQTLLQQAKILNDLKLNSKPQIKNRTIEETSMSSISIIEEKKRQIFVHIKQCYISELHSAVYIVMQKCDGDLYDSISSNRFNSNQKKAKISKDLIEGLQQLHRIGYIHRDIKPGNILLKNGNYMFSDFGISKKIDRGSVLSLSTAKNQGTTQYMHPDLKNQPIPEIGSEQYKKYDKRYDWYSLGIVIIEIWKGFIDKDYHQFKYFKDKKNLLNLFNKDEDLAEKVHSFITY